MDKDGSNRKTYRKQQQRLEMTNLAYTIIKSGVLGFAGTFYVKMAVNVVLRVFPSIPQLIAFNKRAWSRFLPKLFEDCLPIGVAFGVIVGVVQGIMKVLKHMNLGVLADFRGAIAILVASPTFFLIPPSWTEWFSTVAFLRALEVGAKRGVETGYLPEIPNSELLVMIPGSIGVVLAYVYWPLAMGNGYLTFFNTFFQQKQGIEQFRRVMLGQNINAELMDLVRKTRQYPYLNAPPYPRALVTYKMYDKGERNLWKELMHPSMNFPTFIVYYFAKGWIQAMGYYFTIFLLPTLAFNPMVLIRKPFAWLTKLLPDLSTAALFLTSYCTFAFHSVPASRLLGINMTNFGLSGGFAASVIAGIAGGVAILIESPWRRLEVAQFVLQKGMVSAWERFYKHQLSEASLQRLYFILFTTSTSYLVHAYTNYPQNVRRLYRTLFAALVDDASDKNSSNDAPLKKQSLVTSS